MERKAGEERTDRSVLKEVAQTVEQNVPAVVVGVGTLALAALMAATAGPGQVINALVTGGMWALMAMGLALIYGVMKIPYFAHGESFMLGAYVSYFVYNPLSEYLRVHPAPLVRTLSPLVGFASATVAGMLAGVILERLLFRQLRVTGDKGWVMNAFLLTLGISFMLTNGTLLVLGPNFRGVAHYWNLKPVRLLGALVAVDRLIAFGVSMLAIAGLWMFLQRTRTGRAIRAVSQDETGAQMMGVNLDFIYPLTFGLGTATAALAGASLLFLFQAYPTVGQTPNYVSWYVVILAGLGNVAGAIAGGFIVAIAQAATQHFFGVGWTNVVPLGVMVLILVLVPSGIFGSKATGT